jgi:hypothetical protein
VGGGGLPVGAARVVARWSAMGEGRWLAAVRGEAVSNRPPFIGVGRWWKGRDSARGAFAVNNGGSRKNLTVDPTGGAPGRNSRPIERYWMRPVMQGRADLGSGDAERSAMAVVEVTGRAGG